jgi:3-dehydroquinate synthase
MSEAMIVPVEIPGARYDVTVEPGLLRRAGDLLRQRTKLRKVAIVTDSHVAALHLPKLRESLAGGGFEAIEVIVPHGEAHKTFADLQLIYDRLLDSGIERGTPMLALGGGVIGDMAGFAAATLLRGLPFIQIPTTLLAMVDASVGGKTAVNHQAGKNLIGAFHQPQAVWIDPDVLRTLPAREIRSGLAECIKHDLIRDAEGFADIEKKLEAGLTESDWPALVAHNVSIKAKVVAADPHEKGERAHLNLGHTFGHAIESVSRYAYSHGESVALGIVAAAHLSRELELLNDVDVARITRVIGLAKLPVNGLTLPDAALITKMSSDKKVQDGRLRFILLDRIGHAIVRDDISLDFVRDAFDAIRS